MILPFFLFTIFGVQFLFPIECISAPNPHRFRNRSLLLFIITHNSLEDCYWLLFLLGLHLSLFHVKYNRLPCIQIRCCKRCSLLEVLWLWYCIVIILCNLISKLRLTYIKLLSYVSSPSYSRLWLLWDIIKVTRIGECCPIHLSIRLVQLISTETTFFTST